MEARYLNIEGKSKQKYESNSVSKAKANLELEQYFFHTKH
jgi:hypothetical protein